MLLKHASSLPLKLLGSHYGTASKSPPTSKLCHTLQDISLIAIKPTAHFDDPRQLNQPNNQAKGAPGGCMHRYPSTDGSVIFSTGANRLSILKKTSPLHSTPLHSPVGERLFLPRLARRKILVTEATIEMNNTLARYIPGKGVKFW